MQMNCVLELLCSVDRMARFQEMNVDSDSINGRVESQKEKQVSDNIITCCASIPLVTYKPGSYIHSITFI